MNQQTGFTIRPVVRADADAWARMRQELWPAPPGEHTGEIEAFFDGVNRELAQVLLVLDENGRPAGFAELSLRSHVDGCSSSPVGYLEGWFVVEAFRRRGIGRALVEAAERWAREQGCSEFGSDTTIDNSISAAAHKALGFEETDRLISFRKRL